jgi:hypothetical protein
MSAQSLVGMCFMRDDAEYYRIGKVVDVISEDVCLLFFENMKDGQGQPPLELVCIEEMVSINNDGNRRFTFYKTRADLDAWLDWLNSPSDSKTKVVSLIKK